MKLTLTMLICSFFVTIQPAYSQGYIVTNGVSIDQGNTVDVIQNPATGDYTGFHLGAQSATSFIFDSFADEGVRTFIVSIGSPISLQPIVALNYPEMISGNTYTFDEGLSFYLGFYTGYNPFVIENGTAVYTGVYENPVFGWGAFINNGGHISMLDSALEYGGDGIYAGTLNIIQPVPEPGTWVLTALGGMILFWKRKRW